MPEPATPRLRLGCAWSADAGCSEAARTGAATPGPAPRRPAAPTGGRYARHDGPYAPPAPVMPDDTLLAALIFVVAYALIAVERWDRTLIALLAAW